MCAESSQYIIQIAQKRALIGGVAGVLNLDERKDDILSFFNATSDEVRRKIKISQSNCIAEDAMKKPYLIEFSKIGSSSIGYISVAEEDKLPFRVRRVFWTYFTPESVLRGRHAHYKTEQILFALSGRIVVTTELADGEISVFPLEKPNVGVYIPPNAWHTMQYSHTAVQLVLASEPYDENDYIRDYEKFKQVWGQK